MEKIKEIKILVVDDEQGWRDLLCLELSSESCIVTTALNPSDALSILRREPFDLVITDVQMPGKLDGIDLIQTWRLENPSQKAIFITGYALEEKLDRALEAGSVMCLRKPFESQMLMNAIQTLLGK